MVIVVTEKTPKTMVLFKKIPFFWSLKLVKMLPFEEMLV